MSSFQSGRDCFRSIPDSAVDTGETRLPTTAVATMKQRVILFIDKIRGTDTKDLLRQKALSILDGAEDNLHDAFLLLQGCQSQLPPGHRQELATLLNDHERLTSSLSNSRRLIAECESPTNLLRVQSGVRIHAKWVVQYSRRVRIFSDGAIRDGIRDGLRKEFLQKKPGRSSTQPTPL